MRRQDAAREPPVDAWAEVRDLRVRYLGWGGDGPPVPALHGLASSAHWYDVVTSLLGEQFRIISPDQRGHGQTTQAAAGYDWRSLSLDAVALLDYLGISRSAVMGHSWGANVSHEGVGKQACRYPEAVDRLAMPSAIARSMRELPEPT